MKRSITWILILLTLFLLTSCGNNTNEVISNSSTPTESSKDTTASSPITNTDSNKQHAFATSTTDNDTDVGLKNIKIDSAEMELTDAQKKIIQYFDDDYMEVEDYDLLKRYPDIFTNIQIRVFGDVAKVFAMDESSYQFALDDYEDGYSMVINCPLSSTRFIEGDWISVYGLYVGEKQYEIDGKTYILPTIDAHSKTSLYEMGVVLDSNLYSLDHIKTIAETIFGSDIEIRKPVIGDEGFPGGDYFNMDSLDCSFVVELEDQSNAKFGKYLFSREVGYIKDMRSSDNILRNIEFSADFEHFFLFTYDNSLETLTLEYYDSELNKIWKREFSETANALYDYTKNNIYLLANNELYIINIETGEDTFTPTYVGDRYDIRKLSDGIFLLGNQKSDALMKLDLQGNMVWKTNLPADLFYGTTQLSENKILLGCSLDDDYWMHYISIDNSTGAIIQDAVMSY